MDQAASILGRDGQAAMLDLGRSRHRLVLPQMIAVHGGGFGHLRQLERRGTPNGRSQLEEGLDALGIDSPSDWPPTICRIVRRRSRPA